MTDLARSGHELGVMPRVLCLLALVACSSEPVVPADAGDDAATTPDSHVGFPDAGSDATDAAPTCVEGACPASVPANGSACSGDFFCEYGPSPLVDCNTTATCIGNSWHVTPASDAGCAQGASCPATFADATGDGGVVCGSASKFRCDYLEGTCGCDNGAWACAKPNDPSCPAHRPRYGTACAPGSPTCDYGADCTFIGGPDVECKCGRWQVPPPPGCPPP